MTTMTDVPTLYGHPMSRAHRNLWMLRELDVPYAHVPTDFLHGGNKTTEFLALNPNGKVPVLVDGDLVLWESLAINLYLARRYPSPLSARSPQEHALILQWTLWAATEVEKTLFVASENLRLFAPPLRRAEEAALALAKLARPFAVLDAQLRGRDFLLGARFSVADINLAGVMSLVPIAGVDVSAWPDLSRWLTACLARPAADDWTRISFTVPRPPTEAAWMQSLM